MLQRYLDSGRRVKQMTVGYSGGWAAVLQRQRCSAWAPASASPRGSTTLTLALVQPARPLSLKRAAAVAPPGLVEGQRRATLRASP